MLSQLLNELTCWVNHLMSQVIKFHVLLYVISHFLNHDSQLYTQSESLIITSFFSFLDTSSLDLLKWEYIIIFSFFIVMSFNNHLHTVKEINALNHSSVIFCHYCFFHFCLCIIMNNYKKCVKYTCCECLCIDVSWKTLNRVHDKLESDILQVKFKQSQLLSEQTHVAAKLNYLCKMLWQINSHAKEKTLCLLQKLFNEKKVINNSSSEILSQLLNTMSFNFWQFISLFSSQNVEVFSHSSWGFSWALKYFLRYHNLFILWDSELSH